ncbi:DUF6600 domain-containing protein [Haloferula sargassicola]|uniref:Uncharacterized protein n=1 Tax=Haloferula sargassicola TaxID=490096 RepID=A0ABP9UMZ9_9BACT
MKKPILLLLAGSCLIAGCDRISQTSDRGGDDAAIAALDEAREAARLEREALEAERQRLEAERIALEDMNAVDNEDLGEIDPVDSVPVAVTVDDDAPDAERAMLEAWENELTEREKELAGREALEDEIEPLPESYQEPVADYGLFYNSLDDQGEWFDTPDYGYIFQPTVVVQDRSWRPYTHGRWVCSDRGWMWISEEPFGWATYHYGRWVLLAGRGWCWVPGGEWAPAWVAWRHGGGHVGWAPLPPETLGVSGHGWGVSVEADFGIGESWFTFVEERYIAAPIWRHCVPFNRYRGFWGQARPCTNFYYAHGRPMACGPAYAALRKHVHGPWPVRRIEIDPIGGIRHPGMRLPHQRDRDIRVFAPSLNAAWNPAIRPPKVAKRLQDLRVERAPGGVNREWMKRFEDQRRQREQAQKQWAGKFDQPRQQQLRQNRLAAVNGRNQQIKKRLEHWKPTPAGVPGNRPRPDQGRPQVDRGPRPTMPGNGSAADRLRAAQQAQAEKLKAQQELQREKRQQAATDQAAARQARADQLKQQQERLREKMQQAGKGTSSPRQPSGNGALRQKQEAAQEAMQQRQRAQEQQRQTAQEKLRQQQEAARRTADERSARREQQKQEAQEKARQQQAQARQAAQQRAAQQEQQRQQAQEKMRQQREEARRAAQQRAEQQERQRQQAQEKMRQQQEERQRQQAREQARQQQEEARRAAQERARQQQEQARQAAEERARQQQERQRQNQERLREQQERARQQQDQARQAAQERARQQQERLRQIQEERQQRRGR